MGIQNMVEFFSELGIEILTDENGKMTFIDTKTNKKMETYYSKKTLPFLGNDEMESDVSLEKVMNGGRIVSHSNDCGLSFQTSNIIDGKKTNGRIIDYMEYATIENGNVTELTTLKYENGGYPKDSNITLETKNQQGFSKLVMFSDGKIRASQNGDNNLSKQEMISILNNNHANSVSDYYSPIYPRIKESIVNASKSKTL